jgi:hypothetical protein
MSPKTDATPSTAAASDNADTAGSVVAGSSNPNYVPLDEPIRRGEQTIEGVTLRKPRAGELRGVQLAQLMMMDVAALQTVLPRITTPTLTAHDVGNLDPADLMELALKVQGFFMTKAERESLPA